MSRKMSKRVAFSPDGHDHNKPNTIHKVVLSRKRVIGIWSFRLHSSSPMEFLKEIGSKVQRVLRTVSMRKSRSSRRVSSSSTSTTLSKSRSYADESHRAEAIEDCIEFLNSSSSSSSLQRSSSVSSTS